MIGTEQVLDRFDSLLGEACEMESERELNVMGYLTHPDAGTIRGWVAGCEDLLVRVFGEDGSYTKHFTETYEGMEMGMPELVPQCSAILRAAQEAVAQGYLFDVETLARAEVFDDLVDVAQHLHENGYHLPAASIAGAVLEDSLRKLCDAQGVDRSGCRGINALNERLRQADIYPQPQWRQIQAWGDLRNQVDHHDFEHADEVDADAVERMIAGLRDFIVRYLT